MATTPNYSWPTPDDTDLVRNGAEDMRDLGNAIDSTVGDIDQATTKGDLLVYDGTDYQRLPVGADGEYIVADSGEANGVKWDALTAGAFTLIASGTMSGSSVNLTSIPSGYKELMLRAWDVTTNATSGFFVRMNNTTSSVYNTNVITSAASSISNSTSASYAVVSTTDTTANTPRTAFVFKVYLYDQVTSTTGRVPFEFFGWDEGNNTYRRALGVATFGTITEINLVSNTSTFNGGTYELYGVN